MKYIYFIISTLLFSHSIYAEKPCKTASCKVGQLMMIGFDEAEINDNSAIVYAIKNYHIGGVIIQSHFTKNGIKQTRNIQNTEQLKKLTAQLQYYAKKYGNPPVLIAINQESGIINELSYLKDLKLKNNYSQQELGKLNNNQFIYQQAYEQGKILKQLGINLNLAPVADIEINSNNPAIAKLQRSYSKNPITVIKDLQQAIKGYKNSGIFCTLKHFPGLGSANSNTDYAITDVTTTWQPIELKPYQYLIQKNEICNFVMVTHLINRHLDPNGIPASLSKKITTDLLRKQLNYKGITITDDMDAKAIRAYTSAENAIKMALLAGNDIIIYGGTQNYDAAQDAKILHKTLTTLYTNNPAVNRKINNAYQRIIVFKSQNLK